QGIQFLAEKVETLEEFEKAKKLGYELFQGYFFAKPEILKSTMVQPVQANYIRLLGEINSADMNFDTLENVVSNDLALTYSLLKLINSSFFGLRRQVTSVKHAIALLGEQEIKKWGTLVVLKGLGEEKPEELVHLSMIRARFMELIGKHAGLDRAQSSYLFLSGLLSLLNVILDTTMTQVLEEISVSEIVKDILIYERGPLFQFYQLAILYEKGKFDEVDSLLELIDIQKSDLTDAYLDTIEWSKNFK
ncbi:MAG TPA: hypothetical protein DCY20_03275, partial [Firmicutes bacterium]|nr:hypothetical protein [Bacillota bacterium]